MDADTPVTNLVDDDLYEDRYRKYEAVQNAGGVFWDASLGSWIVLGYDLVTTGLNNDAFSVVRETTTVSRMAPREREEFRRLDSFYARWLMFQDAPEHTRIRQSLQPFFTPMALEHYDGDIDASTNAILNSLSNWQTFDLLKDFARPLSMRILLDFVGLRDTSVEKAQFWGGSSSTF